ncbi:MAG: cation:proton antiporter [Actinomycetota bacterium]|nr:cation:proton antiporter [Actinomycetota bacterium]
MDPVIFVASVRTEPAFGFMVVALIIIFGPFIAQKLHLPGLIGLLIGGALIGPNVLSVLPDFSGLESVGDIGVLYLIFLAGLGLDLRTFAQYRKVSASFGLITATIPWVLGTVVALLSDFDLKAAILIGSFWASFTLVSYGVVTRYGLTRNPSVSATVGASSITDTIGLLALALIVGSETGDSNALTLILTLGAGLLALAAYCGVVYPQICRWVFASMGKERELRFMMLLVGLTSAAVVADVLGIEPLIGAFFIGVGLNRLVPNESALMARTDFFGNALFIPAFLVSVGILVDPEVMFSASTLRLAAGLGAALLIGKAAAAWLTGRIYRFSVAEVGLMFSLSSAQAAATLASTIIGFEIGLYGNDVVNAVMVVIVISLFVSSLGSNYYAPRIEKPTEEKQRLGEAILVPVTTQEGVSDSLWLAGQIAEYDGGRLIPLIVTVPEDGGDIAARRLETDGLREELRGLGLTGDPQLRVDRSIAGGVQRTTQEENASLVLMGWPGRRDARTRLLGGTLDEIAAAVDRPVALAALQRQSFDRILLVANHGDLSPGQRDELLAALSLAEAVAATERNQIYIGPIRPEDIREVGLSVMPSAEHLPGPSNRDTWIIEHGTKTDLLVVPAAGRPFDLLEGPLNDSGRSLAVVTTRQDGAAYSSERAVGVTTAR